MEMKEILEITKSFVAGLGEKDNIDVNNAVFIARELLGLNLPLKFRGAGRHGVKSLELYRILYSITPDQEPKNQKAFNLGKILSEFNSRELMLIASYLWNKGRSNLDEVERKEAFELLQKKFPTMYIEGGE